MNTPQCTYNDPYRRGQARKFSNEIKAAITISKYSENYKLYSRKSGTLVADNDNLNPDYRYNKTYQIYSRRGRTLMAETDNRYSDFKYNKTYQIYSRRGRTLMAENDNRNPDFRYNKTYQIYSRRGRTLMAENDNRNPDFRYNKTYQSYSHRGRTLMSENDNRNPDFKYNKTYQIYSRRGRTLMAENDNWSPDFKYNKTYQIYSRRGRALMAENEEWSPDVHHFTMLANTQCPYADFCLTNASQSLPPGKMSCCKSCHCDYECGHRIDCCIDVIDTFNIVETEGLVCVAPRIGYAETDPKTLPNYNMIDRCLLNNTHDCKNVSTALWGALYPVYSPSRDLIFFNKECAICSDVQDYLNWNTYLSCLHPSVNIDEMIIDLAEGRCKLDFYPPEGAIVDKYICYNTVVDSCNITGYWLEYDPFVEAACRIIHAPISGYGYNFANIFCKLCNGFRHNPLATCDPAHGKRFSHWITYLLDYRVASPHVSEKESEQSSLGNERCDMFSIQHPYKVNIHWRIQRGRLGVRTPLKIHIS